MNDLLTSQEAADLVGVSMRTLIRIGEPALVQRGRAGGSYIPNLYSREAVLALKAARDTKPCALCKSQPSKPGRPRTCGHPRCVKQWRILQRKRQHQERKARDAAKQAIAQPRPPSGTMTIIRAWHHHRNLEQRDRYIATAMDTGVPVATVISVVRYATKGV